MWSGEGTQKYGWSVLVETVKDIIDLIESNTTFKK